LVASKTAETAKQGLDNLMTTTSIYRDEYNNQLDDPRMTEDLFGFFLTPIRYIAYKYKLV